MRQGVLIVFLNVTLVVKLGLRINKINYATYNSRKSI
jgi:hypothetical protein